MKNTTNHIIHIVVNEYQHVEQFISNSVQVLNGKSCGRRYNIKTYAILEPIKVVRQSIFCMECASLGLCMSAGCLFSLIMLKP